MNAATIPETVAISSAQVADARRRAQDAARSVLEELQADLALPPDVLVASIARSLGIESTRLSELESASPDFASLKYADAVQRQCVLATRPDGSQVAVLVDPFDDPLRSWLTLHRPAYRLVLVDRHELAAWLARWEERIDALSFSDATGEKSRDATEGAEEISLARIGADPSPVIQFVNSTLFDALKAGASDIHLESDAAGMSVKFRLDGVLNPVGRVDGNQLAEQILSRIKVMAELDIAERRVPQDGRLQVLRSGRAIDVRVSVMPSIHGEDAVLRILDRQALADELHGLTLRSLGFDQPTADRMRRLATLPHGMVLVTGPTGSGKTTTLYAALTDTHNPQDKTITIEDPVEYHLPGILQIPVNEKKGLTFARGLRSILRHDPDRILVGEIRDPETAQIAVQSALTGHLVFTTVHANNVLDVFGRFAQFGIDGYSFVSALNGILAQRLVRKLCPHCAREEQLSEPALRDSGVPAELSAQARWKAPLGCAQCRATGYRGRFAIGELLRLNPELRSLISERAPFLQIEAAAQRAGLVSLRLRALEAAASGATSLAEVNRVTVA
jgi:general secretion pathway protein E